MKHIVLLVAPMMVLLTSLAAQSVKVVSPNGGEPLVLGQTWPISWTATGVNSNIKIHLIKPGGALIGVIAPSLAPGSSPYPWTIGLTSNGMAAAGSYKVRVMSLDGTVKDESNNSFTLADAAEPPQPPQPGGTPTIVVTTPNGGENWGSGSTKNITWNAANWTGTVRLELWQSGVDKGDIASGIPSAPGDYPWTVGKLVSGSGGSGSGYKVRVVREYKGGPYSPVPLSQLKDESDGEFSISLLKMPGSKTDFQPIKVSSPKEGAVFTYGPYAGPNTYGIYMTIQWETQYDSPFVLELHDMGGKKLWEIEMGSEVSVQRLPTINLYSMKYLFVPENSVPGWYRFRIMTAGGIHSGSSGKFRLREVKVLEETIPAGIDNHYHSESTDYSFGHLFNFGTKTQFQNLPAKARVGFENKYETESAGQYAYLGHVFRSQLTVNLDRFKNLKGKFLDADLYIERKEHHNNYQNGINLCGDKLYVLSGPWGKNNVMETPGVLLQSLSQSLIGQHIDVTKWFNAWLSGQSPNYGLLLTALSESFNHENNWCVSYFHVVFNTKFQTEE